MPQTPDLAVIGGSGLYQFAGLTDTESLDIDTPFGKPSSPVTMEISCVQYRAAPGKRLGAHRVSPW